VEASADRFTREGRKPCSNQENSAVAKKKTAGEVKAIIENKV
jgi:hypothetical protein